MYWRVPLSPQRPRCRPHPLLFMAFMLCVACEHEPDPLATYSRIDDFSLIERSGTLVTRAEMEGKIWVADFIFTRCAGPCPMMSQYMSMLQPALAYSDTFKLVSITVDPEHDTPEVMARYAESYDADPQKWWFLSGEKVAILDLARNSMKVGVDEATEASPIIHSTYFILIDHTGTIRGYHNSKEPDFLTRIAIDAERLRQEMIRDAGSPHP